jgi:hypothetical protein
MGSTFQRTVVATRALCPLRVVAHSPRTNTPPPPPCLPPLARSPLAVAHLRLLGLSPFAAAAASAFAARASREASAGSSTASAAHFPHVSAWLAEVAAAAEGGDSAACAYTASALRPPSPWQRGCPDIVPGLTAAPLWWPTLPDAPAGAAPEVPLPRPHPPPPLLAFLARAAHEVDALVAELRAYRAGLGPATAGTSHGPAAGAFRPYAGPGGRSGVDSGAWNVLYLQLHNVDCSAAGDALPRAAALVAAAPRPYGHALVSSLAPRTHITAHTGPTNRKLRIQLPLYVPETPTGAAAGGGPCRLRVGPATVTLHHGTKGGGLGVC